MPIEGVEQKVSRKESNMMNNYKLQGMADIVEYMESQEPSQEK